MDDKTKVCTRCRVEKHWSAFNIEKAKGKPYAYCRPCTNDWQKEKRTRNRALGLCACGDPVRADGKGACDKCNSRKHTSVNAIANTRAFRLRHKDRLAKEQKVAKDALKLEIFNVYGGPHCACPNRCSVKQILVLTIDHIDGGGNQHRKEIKGSFYKWLKKNNFPPGYRVLCMNCNFSWGIHGVCHHD